MNWLNFFADINECTEGGSTCSPGQNCVNSIGSFKCISLCPKGSYMDNGKCTGKLNCFHAGKFCMILLSAFSNTIIVSNSLDQDEA